MKSPSLPAASASAQHKRQLFVRILKEEFLRELQYIWDVINKRAPAKDDFVQQLVSPLVNLLSGILPAATVLFTSLGALAAFSVNHLRNQNLQVVANLRSELDLAQLTILVDECAREALRRYESFIVDSLSDDPELGVIPFARVGAQRMLENLIRYGKIKGDTALVELNEAILLAGLIEGRSGSWVEGFSNQILELKQLEKDWLGRERPKHIDAEDVYGRAGMRRFEIQDGKLVDELYIREKAKHHELPAWKKMQSVVQVGQEWIGNFGYVCFSEEKDHRRDPKAGYVIMPLAVIQDRYDFKLHKQEMVSLELKRALRTSSHSIIQVDKNTIGQYLAWSRSKEGQNRSLLEYVRIVLKYPAVELICCSDNLSEWDLRGARLDHTDLSGAILTGDLTNTDLSASYLVGTIFKSVSSARGMNLRGSHCEYLKAPGVNFQDGDFTQANFSYADLQGAQLAGCKTLGAVWTGANLKDLRDHADLVKQQQREMKQLQSQVASQHQHYRELAAAMRVQTQQIEEIQRNFSTKIEASLKGMAVDSKEYPTLQALSSQVQHLTQQFAAKLIFEANCQKELRELKETLSQAVDKETIHQLQMNLKAVQEQLQRVTGSSFQRALSSFQSDCRRELDVLNQKNAELAKQLSGLEKRFIEDCQLKLTAQEKRLFQLEKQMGALEHDFREKLEALKKRVNVLEQWAADAKQAFSGIASDREQVKNKLQNLEGVMGSLLEEQKNRQLEQQRLEEAIQHIQQQVAQKGQKDEVESLKKQLDGLQQQLAEMKGEDHHQAVLAPLQGLQQEFAAQKEKIEKAAKLNASVRQQLQKSIGQIEQRQQIVENLVVSFQVRWQEQVMAEKQERTDLQEFLTQTYSACDARLEELDKRVTELERWALETDEQLEKFQEAQKDNQKEMKALKQELTCLIQQQHLQQQQQLEHQQKLLVLRAEIKQAADSKTASGLKTKLQSLASSVGGWFKKPSLEVITGQFQALKTAYTEQESAVVEALEFVDEEARFALESTQQQIQKQLTQLSQINESLQTAQAAQEKANEKALANLKSQLVEVNAHLTERIDALSERVDEVEVRLAQLYKELAESHPRYTVAVKLLALRKKMLEDEYITAELSCYIAPNGQSQLGNENSDPLYTWVEKEFLNTDCRVLLLQGLPGSGKSTFNRHLLRQVWNHPAWQEFKPGRMPPKVLLPLFAPLGSSVVDSAHLFDYLRDIPELVEHFTEAEINVLKSDYQLLWIADGYDEIPGYPKSNVLNIYDKNFSQYNDRIKLLISCRPLPRELDESTYFIPHQADGKLERSRYRARYVAPFTPEQRVQYVERYLVKQKEQKDQSTPLWPNAARYEKEFAEIPQFASLINTPLLLMIAVQVLPEIIAEVEKAIKPAQKSSMISLDEARAGLTQKRLFDHFVAGWFNREAQKAWHTKNFLKEPEDLWGSEWHQEVKARHAMHEEDPKIGFLKASYAKFCQEFALHLREVGRVSIQYPSEVKKRGRLDKNKVAAPQAEPELEWAEALLGEDENGDLVRTRRGCPIYKSPSNEYGFIHPLLIAYFETSVIQPIDRSASSSALFKEKSPEKPPEKAGLKKSLIPDFSFS